MTFRSADSDTGLGSVNASIWVPLLSRRVPEGQCPLLQASDKGTLKDLKSLWLRLTSHQLQLPWGSVGCTSRSQFQADPWVSPFLSPSQL